MFMGANRRRREPLLPGRCDSQDTGLQEQGREGWLQERELVGRAGKVHMQDWTAGHTTVFDT
jgi:hypothetical protein